MGRVLNRALDTGLVGHLGYEKGDPAGRGSGNSRNESTAKTGADGAGCGAGEGATGRRRLLGATARWRDRLG